MALSFLKSSCSLSQELASRKSHMKEIKESTHFRECCHVESSAGIFSSMSNNTMPCYSQLSLKKNLSFGRGNCGVTAINKLHLVNASCFVLERGANVSFKLNHNQLKRNKTWTCFCCIAAGDEAGRSFNNNSMKDQANAVQVDVRPESTNTPESKSGTFFTTSNDLSDEFEVEDSYSKPDSSADKLNLNSSFQIVDKPRNVTSNVTGVEELLKKKDLKTSVKVEAQEASLIGDCKSEKTSSNSQNTSKEVVRRKRKLQNGNEKKMEEGVLDLDGVRIVEKGAILSAFWCFGSWLYKTWLVQETYGIEHLPLHRGMFFLASNHSSHLDCGALFVAAWAGGVKNVYALGARDYFFSHPVKAWFVSNFMHVIPFNRRGFSQWEVDVIQHIKDNSTPESPSAIVIFPEGTRTKDGSLQRFKSGVSFLSEKLDVPVVPACVKGTLDALPKGRTIPHRHKVKVQFGSPLEMRTYLEEMVLSDNESTSTTIASQLRETDKSFQGKMPMGNPVGNPVVNPIENSVVIEPQSVIPTNIPVPFIQPSSSKIPRNLKISSSKEGQQSPESLIMTNDVRRESESNTRDQKSYITNDAVREGGNNNTRAQRRLAQQKFTDDLRNSVSVMLGDYSLPRKPSKPELHRPIADRLGGGKWKLIGWLGYWLPMTFVIIAAVSLAAIQSWKTVGREPLRGYATAVGVFGALKDTGGVRLLLGIAVIAIFLRAFIQWAWPYFVLSPSTVNNS